MEYKTCYYSKDTVLVQRKEVVKIDYLNQPVNGKLKSCFYVPSYLCPEGKMVIYWGRVANFKAGTIINMVGKPKEDVFIAYSIQILKLIDEGETQDG